MPVWMMEGKTKNKLALVVWMIRGALDKSFNIVARDLSVIPQ